MYFLSRESSVAIENFKLSCSLLEERKRFLFSYI
jgi:hypothetical protein